MKHWGTRETNVITALTCDRCKTRHDDVMERQEFLCWSMTGGYGNTTFGDMNHLTLDLCQYCVKEVLGEWVRVTDQRNWDENLSVTEQDW